MSDNPFAEPDDSEKTIIRPVPGGARQAAPRPPPRSAPTRTSAAVPLEGTETLAAGTRDLLSAAAPLLQLLGRLRNTARPPDQAELRERTIREIRAFERRAREAQVPEEELRLAHYALCASLDDVVLNTPWGSSGVWNGQSLVASFHKEARSGEHFFRILKGALERPGTMMPLIELMYLCMSLGFIGQYRVAGRGTADLDRIREETYAVIMRQRSAGNPELSPHWRGVDAPYRPVRGHVPVWVCAAAGLVAVAFVFFWASNSLNGRSDDLFAQMLADPPTKMPTISRQAVVRPPPPPPEPPAPGPADRLRTFLKPEIDRKLVSVVGTPAVPIVRITNPGMFLSASATVKPEFRPLLERIGLALKDEPGAVRVIGYTDNQKIRSVAFPSNYALSTGRAQAAEKIIAGATGDASRFTAEGRADADPIAPNTTAEGREQNRRIEVQLVRRSS